MKLWNTFSYSSKDRSKWCNTLSYVFLSDFLLTWDLSSVSRIRKQWNEKERKKDIKGNGMARLRNGAAEQFRLRIGKGQRRSLERSFQGEEETEDGITILFYASFSSLWIFHLNPDNTSLYFFFFMHQIRSLTFLMLDTTMGKSVSTQVAITSLIKIVIEWPWDDHSINLIRSP